METTPFLGIRKVADNEADKPKAVNDGFDDIDAAVEQKLADLDIGVSLEEANTWTKTQAIQSKLAVGIGATLANISAAIGNTVAYFKGSSDSGDSVLLESSGPFAALVARGGGEADLILQHMNAPQNQQAFYFNVKNGIFSILVLGDALNTVVRKMYAVRATDAAFALGGDAAFAYPAQHSVQAVAPGRVVGLDQGALGQTANLREWRDGNGNLKSFINASGDYCLKDTATGADYKIQCTNGALGAVPV